MFWSSQRDQPRPVLKHLRSFYPLLRLSSPPLPSALIRPLPLLQGRPVSHSPGLPLNPAHLPSIPRASSGQSQTFHLRSRHLPLLLLAQFFFSQREPPSFCHILQMGLATPRPSPRPSRLLPSPTSGDRGALDDPSFCPPVLGATGLPVVDMYLLNLFFQIYCFFKKNLCWKSA